MVGSIAISSGQTGFISNGIIFRSTARDCRQRRSIIQIIYRRTSRSVRARLSDAAGHRDFQIAERHRQSSAMPGSQIERDISDWSRDKTVSMVGLIQWAAEMAMSIR
jgi:hypothetical protein